VHDARPDPRAEHDHRRIGRGGAAPEEPLDGRAQVGWAPVARDQPDKDGTEGAAEQAEED